MNVVEQVEQWLRTEGSSRITKWSNVTTPEHAKDGDSYWELATARGGTYELTARDNYLGASGVSEMRDLPDGQLTLATFNEIMDRIEGLEQEYDPDGPAESDAEPSDY